MIATALEILKTVYGYDAFRDRRRATGGGKRQHACASLLLERTAGSQYAKPGQIGQDEVVLADRLHLPTSYQ